MRPPLLGRTAYALLHFTELLVGPRCQTLRVASPQRYHFDRPALLAVLAQLAVQLGKRLEFVVAIAEVCVPVQPLSLHVWHAS
jgi:Ubiquitin elongating factor core